jgi:hypothetical protein
VYLGAHNVGRYAAEIIDKMTSPHVFGRRGRDDRSDGEKRIRVFEKIHHSRVRAALLGQHARPSDYAHSTGKKKEDGRFQSQGSQKMSAYFVLSWRLA